MYTVSEHYKREHDMRIIMRKEVLLEDALKTSLSCLSVGGPIGKSLIIRAELDAIIAHHQTRDVSTSLGNQALYIKVACQVNFVTQISPTLFVYDE